MNIHVLTSNALHSPLELPTPPPLKEGGVSENIRKRVDSFFQPAVPAGMEVKALKELEMQYMGPNEDMTTATTFVLVVKSTQNLTAVV